MLLWSVIPYSGSGSAAQHLTVRERRSDASNTPAPWTSSPSVAPRTRGPGLPHPHGPSLRHRTAHRGPGQLPLRDRLRRPGYPARHPRAHRRRVRQSAAADDTDRSRLRGLGGDPRPYRSRPPGDPGGRGDVLHRRTGVRGRALPRTEHGSTSLQEDRVVRRIADKVVVDGVTLTLRPDETVGLLMLGPNASGRLTLLRLPAGVIASNRPWARKPPAQFSIVAAGARSLDAVRGRAVPVRRRGGVPVQCLAGDLTPLR